MMPIRLTDSVLATLMRRNSENGERDGDPSPRFPDNMCAEWLPRSKMQPVRQSYYATRRKIREGHAVLIADAPFLGGMIDKWTSEYLVTIESIIKRTSNQQ